MLLVVMMNCGRALVKVNGDGYVVLHFTNCVVKTNMPWSEWEQHLKLAEKVAVKSSNQHWHEAFPSQSLIMLMCVCVCESLVAVLWTWL